MNKIDVCPKCSAYLSYDGDSREWYCTECDYTEAEKIKFKLKVRKGDLIE